MEKIILVGHGSPKQGANNLEQVGSMVHSTVHPGCASDCVKVAYLQFVSPDIKETIDECARSGAGRIVLHPFFLSAGMHVTKDIPEIIAEARAAYPDIEFIYTEPLGIHEKLAQIVKERIDAAGNYVPEMIEKRSFEIIEEELDLRDIPAERLPIVKRVIHATADFDFKQTLTFHKDAVAAGIKAIRAGKNILTDVEMVKTGISKKRLERWGGKVICAISDDDVAQLSETTGKTRAEIAIEKGFDENVGIVAIGNAPTALLKVVELFKSPIHQFIDSPPLVVGVPVGFVKAFESKALLASQSFPFITTLSRKGGTPVAVAIVNALLKMAEEE